MSDTWPIWILAFLFFGFFGFAVYDITSSKEIVSDGKIHEMTFIHGNQSTTVGMAFTSKGAAPVIATSGHPDEWSVIVYVNDTYIKIECDANEYYHHEIGDEVQIVQDIGGLTGNCYSTNLISK